jgi:hypothetical protein
MKMMIASALLFGAACGPQAGTLTVTIYGEELIEQGIPAGEFVDGWSVRFGKFLLSVGEVSAASGQGAPALRQGAYQVFDVSRSSGGAGHKVTQAVVPGGAYDNVAYVVAPAAAQAGNAGASDLEILRRGGCGLYVEGTATKGGVIKTFRWGFTNRTAYSGCRSTAQVDGAGARTQLTIHGDHLFYDDLFAEEPNVAFDLIAQADADGNGEVTQQELKALDIRTQARYQVGSTGIKDLWDFIAYQTGTIGHIDGEGHCDATSRQ